MTTDMKPGIYKGLDNEDYHAGPGISKSGLWTIHTKSPAHYKFPPEKKMTTEKQANLDFGSALHIGILEPDTFEARVYRGPEDRRGNKWKDAQEYCKIEGKLLLAEQAYDDVCATRDAVHADSWINQIITGGRPVIEASGYWIDEETGALCRFRPDHYRSDIGLSLDLKSTVSAKPEDFAKHVVNFGYHSQEAFYSDGLSALGQPLNGFVFLAVEKESPFAFDIYELPPSIVEEGREIMRQSLRTYAGCKSSGDWYGYRKPAEENAVKELTFPRWAYRNIDAPNALDEEVAA